MPEGNHKQVTILVPVDVDEGIAGVVEYLNTIPGIRTHASCQGTIGEGGPHPYRPQVLVTWATPEVFDRLKAEFDLSDLNEAWCYAHPRRKYESLEETSALQHLPAWDRLTREQSTEIITTAYTLANGTPDSAHYYEAIRAVCGRTSAAGGTYRDEDGEIRTAQELAALLNGRDDFLVMKGLFSEFVDSLKSTHGGKGE